MSKEMWDSTPGNTTDSTRLVCRKGFFMRDVIIIIHRPHGIKGSTPCPTKMPSSPLLNLALSLPQELLPLQVRQDRTCLHALKCWSCWSLIIERCKWRSFNLNIFFFVKILTFWNIKANVPSNTGYKLSCSLLTALYNYHFANLFTSEFLQAII